MRFAFPCLLLFFSIALPALSQGGKDIPTKVITISNTRLKDYRVTANLAWILREDGIITRTNIIKHSIVDSLKFDKRITAIGLLGESTICAADESGGIFKIHENGDTSFLWQTDQQVLDFCFGHDSIMFLVTDKGIFVPAFNRLFYENAHSNPFVWKFNSESWRPTAVYTDTKGNIWLGFSSGEWGGDMLSFSTFEYRFSRFRDKYRSCYVRPVRAFFEIDSVLHFATSMQHMYSLSSNIRKVTDSCHDVFESPLFIDASGDSAVNLYKKQELYIGPTLFNSADSSIYFYCQFGVFRATIKKDLSLLGNWEHLMETKLMWHYGMPDAVGYGMNVSKMFFAGNTLVLVSPSNGILTYDGKQKVLYKTNYKPAN